MSATLFFTSRESLRPVPASYSGHVILPVHDPIFSGSEEEVAQEYLLPANPHHVFLTFLLTVSNLSVSLYSVISESILYPQLAPDDNPVLLSRVTANRPGTIIRVYGFQQLWYVEANLPLVGSIY